MEPAPPRPSGAFATRAVRGAVALPEVAQHPLAPAIWPAATWATDRSVEMGELLNDVTDGYVYGRYDNPTGSTLHGLVASLHEAPAAWSFASGTAAIHATLDVLRGGGAILATPHLYGGTWALLRRLRRDAGWRVDHAPVGTAAAVEAALTDAHAVVYLETVANPTTEVADVAEVARVCRDRGVSLVVDNTFASPYLAQPLTLGATAVVESATKYLGGHGDVVAGVVAGDRSLIHRAREVAIELGASLGAFEAWLVIRGIQTLALRMRHASASALGVARALADHPGVVSVRYPGLPDHPQHDVAARLFEGRGFGGMLSFDLPDRVQAEAFVDACEVFVCAASLGATHSLVIHPSSTTHRQLDEASLAAAGLSPGTVRMSIGIEDGADLLADVARAMDAATATGGGRA